MSYRVWGWGTADEQQPTVGELDQLAPLVASLTGVPVQPPEAPRPLRPLPRPRLTRLRRP